MIYPAAMVACLGSYLGLLAQGMALQLAMLVPATVGAMLATGLEQHFPHRRA